MDERLQAILDIFMTPPPDPLPEVPIAERRRFWDDARDLFNAGAPDRPLERGVLLREKHGRRLTADIYPADGPGPHPVVLYLHGGSWIVWDPTAYHKLSCRFAEAGFLCINLDYALAPEHRFPAALDDCLYAARWAREHAADYGGDPDRLAVAGDSAGGNLAAAVIAAQLAESGSTLFRAAAMIYGIFDFPLLLEIPPGSPFFSAQLAQRTIAEYVGPDTDQATLRDPRLSPVHSPHLAAFPPTQLLAGTHDPLFAQSELFAKVLEGAGVETDLRVYPDMPHGFIQLEHLPPCLEAHQAMWAFLRRHL